MSFIYLASPYSSPHFTIRDQRYAAARAFLAGQAVRGNNKLYSPIVHWHSIACSYKLPYDDAYWWEANRAMLEAATRLWVLKLPGWADSRGVQREISYWKAGFGEPELIDYD